MVLSEKEKCIRCNEGGEVLTCANSDCPIAIHERCMPSPAKFDSLGRFYCPHCLYRQSFVQFNQAKELLHLKKRALKDFIDVKIMGNNKVVPPTVSKSTCETVINNCDQQGAVGKQMHASKNQEVGERQQDSVEVHNHDGHLGNSYVAKENNLGNEPVVEETERNSIGTASLKGIRRAETEDSTGWESEPGVENSDAAGKSSQVKQPSMLPVVSPNGKRKRVAVVSSNGKPKRVSWSHEEEEMLHEGVQKFTAKAKKNIPWMKILEFGGHVFHKTRAPSDLREKWRKLRTKDREKV